MFGKLSSLVIAMVILSGCGAGIHDPSIWSHEQFTREPNSPGFGEVLPLTYNYRLPPNWVDSLWLARMKAQTKDVLPLDDDRNLMIRVDLTESAFADIPNPSTHLRFVYIYGMQYLDYFVESWKPGDKSAWVRLPRTYAQGISNSFWIYSLPHANANLSENVKTPSTEWETQSRAFSPDPSPSQSIDIQQSDNPNWSIYVVVKDWGNFIDGRLFAIETQSGVVELVVDGDELLLTDGHVDHVLNQSFAVNEISHLSLTYDSSSRTLLVYQNGSIVSQIDLDGFKHTIEESLIQFLPENHPSIRWVLVKTDADSPRRVYLIHRMLTEPGFIELSPIERVD